VYPGYDQLGGFYPVGVDVQIEPLLADIRARLSREVVRCGGPRLEGKGAVDVQEIASAIADEFLSRIPAVRDVLMSDVQAALDGDPSAESADEIIMVYPGILSISVHRLAHELVLLGVPVLPRIMSEWAHGQTGVDINPGARIGPRFFLDHATGVVIGETAEIGSNVTLYQGVTLGALSLRRDDVGKVSTRGKRHPTLESNITIYANATVLGGSTVIGEGSTLGGSVFITQSVPPRSVVSLGNLSHRIRRRNERQVAIFDDAGDEDV
jgi:serine O-acetyltransferase